jgi:hypothetical protein
MAPKIAPKRRERKPYHKKDLAAQIDDPQAHGVRVRVLNTLLDAGFIT